MIPIAPISGCDIPIFQYPACSSGLNKIVIPSGPAPLPPSAPVVTSTTITVISGNSIHYQIVASGGPTSYGATGLPSGLTLNTGTGVITGTPVSSGSPFTASISATNATGTGFGTLGIIVKLIPSVSVTGSLSGTPDSNSQLQIGIDGAAFVTFNPANTYTAFSQIKLLLFVPVGTALTALRYDILGEITPNNGPILFSASSTTNVVFNTTPASGVFYPVQATAVVPGQSFNPGVSANIPNSPFSFSANNAATSASSPFGFNISWSGNDVSSEVINTAYILVILNF